MSRIALISTNTSVDPYPVYPLGMAVVARALFDQGHQVRQFDLLAEGGDLSRLEEGLKSFAPAFVLVSLRNLDSGDSTAGDGEFLETDRRVVRTVRRAVNAPIILGGPALSLMPVELLEFLEADYGVTGEGEEAACGLVEALAHGRPWPKLVHGSGPPLDMSLMRPPLFEGGLVRYYLGETGMINLQTKRGCPHACAYCSYPSLEGSRFRFREAGAVADDLAAMKRDHGIDRVFFTDSIFNDTEGRYLELAEELMRRHLGISWAAFFRPEGLDRERLVLLKQSGLYALELGTDAATDATLAGLNKGFSFGDVVEVNRACELLELPAAHFVMFGGPGETADTVRQGLENLRRLPVSAVFAFSGVRIIPGTGLHKLAISQGLIGPRDSLLRPSYYFSPQVDRDSMESSIRKSFKGRRDRVFPPAEGRLRMEVMRRFGYRGLLWDRLLAFGRTGRGKAASRG